MMKFIPTALLKVGDVIAAGRVTAIRRTAKTTYITCGETEFSQRTSTYIAVVTA